MNPLLTTLRETTRHHHARLETRLNVLNPDFSLNDYRNLLTGFLGFYRPFEARLKQHADITLWLPDYFHRLKTPWLEKDLAALSLEASVIVGLPNCEHLPDCRTKSQVMGCLYVIEGSSLGGQVMSRHLKNTFGFDAERAATFFNGYGDETISRWKIMLAKLEDPTLHEAEVAEAANDTFLTLTNWLTEER